jgi:hypothetical protein
VARAEQDRRFPGERQRLACKLLSLNASGVFEHIREQLTTVSGLQRVAALFAKDDLSGGKPGKRARAAVKAELKAELKNKAKGKAKACVEVLSVDDSDSDELCSVVERPAAVAAAQGLAATALAAALGDDEELKLVGSAGGHGPDAMPHAREDCVRFAFGTDEACSACFCYVCQVRAPCPLWAQHHVATSKEGLWRRARARHRGAAAALQQEGEEEEQDEEEDDDEEVIARDSDRDSCDSSASEEGTEAPRLPKDEVGIEEEEQTGKQGAFARDSDRGSPASEGTQAPRYTQVQVEEASYAALQAIAKKKGTSRRRARA